MARPATTVLTLWGGLASTICWPLSAWLLDAVGWRGVCLTYAGLHIAVTLPLMLFAVPRATRPDVVPETMQVATRSLSRVRNRTFWLLAAIFTTASTTAALWSVHLITIIEARGLSLAAAVSLGALVGPAQICARVVEMVSAGMHHPIWTLTTSAVLIAAGVALLWSGGGVLAGALIAYGAGNGVWSIARGALPLALFGSDGYAALMGRLAAPSLVAQALAPLVGAALLSRLGPEALIGLLTALALLNLVGVGWLWRLTASSR